MVSGTSSSSTLVPSTRKRKWNAAHIVKIDLGDDESDEDTSIAVVRQASRDGRRIAVQLHPIPIPHDPPTLAAPYNPPSAEDLGFTMDVIDEADEDEPHASIPVQVSSLTSVPFVRS